MCVRTHSHHGGPTLMTSCKPNYFPKTLPPNTSTLRGRASTYKFWADTVQSITSTNYVSSIELGPVITSHIASFPVLRVLGWQGELLYFKGKKKNHFSFMGNNKEGFTTVSPGIMQSLHRVRDKISLGSPWHSQWWVQCWVQSCAR